MLQYYIWRTKMSSKTWLLSATMLMAPVAETTATTAEYTPEVRAETSATMKQDVAISASTFTGFTAVQQQQADSRTSREDTSAALKSQSSSAHETLSKITPRADVSFINQDPNKYRVEGDYLSGANVIRVEIKERVVSEKLNQEGGNRYDVTSVTPQEKKEGTYYTESEISRDKMLTFWHEHHHQYCHNKTTTTEDGKEIRVSDLPMSLQQVYKVEQADEVGSNIASCIGIRQMYIEAKTQYKQSKEDILNSFPKDKKYKELKQAIEKDANYTVESGKVKFNNAKGKLVEVDISALGQEMETILKENQQKRLKCSSVLKNNPSDERMFGTYTDAIRKGEIDPLNPKDFEKEMALIGTSVAKNWQVCHGDRLSNYTPQCTEVTIDYLRDHDVKDIKPNDANYNKALSAKLTVGGYDFTKYVEPNLKCNNGMIVSADGKLANGATKMNALKGQYGSEFISSRRVEYAYVSEQTGKEKKEFTYTQNCNEGQAYFLTQNAKVGDKIEDIKIKMPEKIQDAVAKDPKYKELENIYKKMENGITVPVTWSATDAKNYNKAISDLRKGIADYSPEDKQQIEQKISELGLDKKKAGERLTEEELAKFTELGNTLRNTGYNYDTSSASQAIFDLTQLYEKKQKESVPALCELCQYFENNAKAGYTYKRAVNKEADADYFYPNPVRVKECIVSELSGTGEKSYENPRIKTEPGKEYQGTKASTVTMMDLSQPFLTEDVAAQRVAEAKNRIAESQKTQQEQQSQNQRVTQVNQSQIYAANRSDGR